MMNCKEIAKKTLSEEPLSFRQKAECFIHLLMCHSCKIFIKQMDNLDHSLKKAMLKSSKEHLDVLEKVKKEILEEVNIRFD
jgi:hypothetical protein